MEQIPLKGSQATVRVFSIDTPEMRAPQQCEKALAGKATQFTKEFLAGMADLLVPRHNILWIREMPLPGPARHAQRTSI